MLYLLMMLNDSQLKIFRTRLQEAMRIIDAELMPLRTDQLNWKPVSGRWSVAECIEHLLLAFEGYLNELDRAIAIGVQKNIVARQPMKISLAGRLMIFAVDPAIKIPIPAPPKFKPPKNKLYSIATLQAFQSCLERLSLQLEASKNLDWNRLTITSPVTALLKLNLGDVFEVLTLHTLRHLKQAQRVILHEKFPK